MGREAPDGSPRATSSVDVHAVYFFTFLAGFFAAFFTTFFAAFFTTFFAAFFTGIAYLLWVSWWDIPSELLYKIERMAPLGFKAPS